MTQSSEHAPNDPRTKERVEPFYKRPLNPRACRIVVLLIIMCLLAVGNGLLTILVAPFLIHAIIGFQGQGRRAALRRCLAPSMMALPIVCAFWVHSHQRVSHGLVRIAQNRFVGFHLFPGIIEGGVYVHDSAGLKYLREGVTEEIASVMTDQVKRFQTFEGSEQVYDCLSVYFSRSSLPMFARTVRYVPVVEGLASVGSIYAGRQPCGWTTSSFYWNNGPWNFGSGSPYASTHVGFHFAVASLASAIPFARGVMYWRRHRHRLRYNLCLACAYDLTGNTSGRCPECGKMIKRDLPVS